jgi:hypothetical protein
MTNPTENMIQEKAISKFVVATIILFALAIAVFFIYTWYIARSKEPNIYWRADFESAQLQPRIAGWHDNIGLSQLTDAHKDCAVESISNDEPGLLKYSGCDDTEFVAGHGFRLATASGLTELNDVLVRICDDGSLDTTADTFHLCTDNWPLYTAKDDPDNLPEFPIDTRTMGEHDSGTGTLKQYENLAVTTGGLGPTSSELCHVEDSTNNMGGDSDILARNGSYFFRCEIRYNLPYEVWGEGNPKNKPRYGLSPPHTTHFDWNEEVWIGFSIYVPSDMEVEDLSAISKHWYGNMVFTIVGHSASMDHLQLRIQSVNGVNHWVFEDTLNQLGVTQDGIETFTDAGAIPQGEWTDFVIRYRGNPFSKATNASQVTGKGQDRVFPANTGILQIWVGAASDPALTLVKDVENAPVGLVPQVGASLRMTFRNYKYGWHHNATTMHRPIVTGWDDIRFGKKERDGTGYSDVHPDGDSMPPQ